MNVWDILKYIFIFSFGLCVGFYSSAILYAEGVLHNFPVELRQKLGINEA